MKNEGDESEAKYSMFSFNEATTEDREAGLGKLIGDYWTPIIKEYFQDDSKSFEDLEDLGDFIAGTIFETQSVEELKEQKSLIDRGNGKKYCYFECSFDFGIDNQPNKTHTIKIKVLADFSKIFTTHPLVADEYTPTIDYRDGVYFDSIKLIN